MTLTRRGLLGAAASSLLLPSVARAQVAEKGAVVVIFFSGSYNALFSAADAYVPSGNFAVTADNVLDVGNGLVVDRSTLGQLPAEVLGSMCTVGVAHGYSDHISGPRQLFVDARQRSYPLQLAAAMGGTAAFRCVHFGQRLPGAHPATDGVSMIGVPDLAMPIALTSSAPGGAGPRRASTALAFRRVSAASQPMFEKNPGSLRGTYEGLHTLLGALERQPPPGVDWPEVAAAYGLSPSSTGAQTFAAQLAGAELMIRAGANMVTLQSTGWDHHGEWPGTRARMSSEIMPALTTFLSRARALSGFNVVTALTGEFARTGGKAGAESGHAGGLSATVFGKRVRQGTTGRPSVSSQGGYALPMGTPATREFWGFLSSLVSSGAQPFGANAHPSLLA
jgi:hypothetical protein